MIKLEYKSARVKEGFPDVPDITTRFIELGANLRHLTWKRSHHVFSAVFNIHWVIRVARVWIYGRTVVACSICWIRIDDAKSIAKCPIVLNDFLWFKANTIGGRCASA